MTYRTMHITVLNPDFRDNPDEMPILDKWGEWWEIAVEAANHLIPGQYPAVRSIYLGPDFQAMSGTLTISDDPGRTVTWTETVQTDC